MNPLRPRFDRHDAIHPPKGYDRALGFIAQCDHCDPFNRHRLHPLCFVAPLP
jgi:hypothetical protein